MKPLKNWDNRTWLSSKRYISQFHKFINKKTKLNKNTTVLDIGCGRANIISFLQKRRNPRKPFVVFNNNPPRHLIKSIESIPITNQPIQS